MVRLPHSLCLRLIPALLCGWISLAAGSPPQDLGRRLEETWRWRELAPASSTQFHECVALHSDGRLFSSYGRVVSVFDGASWKVLGRAPADIISIGPSGDGVLVLSRGGACTFIDDEGVFETLVPTLAGQSSLYSDLGGGEAIITAEAGYFLFRGGQGELLDLPSFEGFNSIKRTADGRLVITEGDHTWIENAGAWNQLDLSASPGKPGQYGPLYRHGEELWLFPKSNSFGLPALRLDGTRFEPATSPVDSELALSVPGRGFLSWHSDHGAQTYRAGAWHGIRSTAGAGGQVPAAAYSDGQRLLLLTAPGRLWSVDLESERWQHAQLAAPFSNSPVQSLSPASAGGLWAGSSRGLLRWQDGAFVERIPEALGIPLRNLTATHEDRAGNVWVGSGSSFLGLLRRTDGVWEQVETPAASFHVHAIREGTDGTLWFTLLAGAGDPSGPAGGLLRFDGETWTSFTVADGLPDNRCYDVLTRRNGDVLVATLRGVALLDGERWTLQPNFGLRAVRLMHESADETLWLGAGIRVPGVRTFRSGRELALPDETLARITIGAIVDDPERGLWFAGRQGVFLLDPAGLVHEVTREQGIPARAFWPIVQLADSVLALGALEGGVVTLQLDDLSSPRVFDLSVTVGESGHTSATWRGRDTWSTTPGADLRYRTREPGGVWSAPQTASRSPLGKLAPGAHSLEVQAIDLHGNRSATPARVNFEVLAPFWIRPATLWGALLLVLLTITGLALHEWSRSRQLELRENVRVAESEDHHRALLERVRALIATFDKRGELSYVSPGLARLLDDAPERISTDKFLSRIGPEGEAEAATLRATLLGRRRGGWTGEIPLIPVDGSPTWLYATLTPNLPNEERKEASWDFVAVDLTERREGERRERELAAKLTQARRLEAIGRLSAGIGHDFNNLLTAIEGNVSIAKRQLEGAGFASLRSNLVEVDLATTQAQALTRRLLSFGRAQSVDVKLLDMDATISGALPIIQRLIQEPVEFSFEPGSAGSIECGEGQIERVLFNLVLNSQDALPGTGRLTVRTQHVILSKEAALDHAPLAAGGYAVLSVEDDGLGMDAATIERACEPFFTTKAEGHGTGLGLATVHGIVSQCGGGLEIRSTPGQGTTIDAYFPLVHSEVLPRSSPPSTSPAAPATVAPVEMPILLFCEDDPGVRSFIAQCLEEYGYRILVAAGPEEALELSAEHTGHLDMLVTDVIMPVMNGFQLAQRLHVERPDLKVLYVSGYSADLLSEEGLPTGEYALLKKPFRPRALLDRVNQMLSARPPDKGAHISPST